MSEIEQEKPKQVGRPAKPKRNIWELIDGPGVRVDRFAPDNADAVRMMENLASQPKVRTRVPREAKEPIDAFISPVLNSVRINIRKGVAVDLPEQLADLIEDSYYKSERALEPTVINPFSGKASPGRLDMKSDAELVGL